MSSTNKTANYELSQFVGTDIPSILNDYNGDMRKIDSAIKNASVAGGDNAVAIAELQSTTARMNTEIGGINTTVNNTVGKVADIEELIPATASAQNKLLTAQEISEIPSITELEDDVAELQGTVADIQSNLDNKHALKVLHFSKDDYSTFGEMLSAIAIEIYKPIYHYGDDIYALKYSGLSGFFLLNESSGDSFVFSQHRTWSQGSDTEFFVTEYNREIHLGTQYQQINSDILTSFGFSYSNGTTSVNNPTRVVNKIATDAPSYDIDILYFDR